MTGPGPAGPSTGLPALDAVLGGLRPGDNVVWRVESIEDYAAVVRPFAARAREDGRSLVYHRFARHRPLVEDGEGARVDRLSPADGFERFTAAIHAAIDAAGRGAFHVFDGLSDLAADWASDLMLGNFFSLTCPYLYALETVTYFGLLRDRHSPLAVDVIRGTTQLFVDVFRRRTAVYVHPLKVDGRHSPTMYLPHAWDGAALRALTRSAELAEALAEESGRELDPAAQLDEWDRKFLEAREVQDAVLAGARPWTDAQARFRGLLRTVLTRDERLGALAAETLDLHDLLALRRRMIGTGLVGGKAAGMLVARALLARTNPAWRRRLEPHDSWFVGADVFQTFLVRNGCWQARREQRSAEHFLDGAAAARERVLAGTFPEAIERQFVAMLESYGQSPIIVRSSSLLEDGFGNAFTGKYDSVFLPNHGSPGERLDALRDAIRTVYASSMSEEALRYRERRGLLDHEEQMAILVQRVSGGVHGRLFYPDVAGVALSYNPYVWSEGIDPEAGVVRLVFGLGTRAVERSDDDYTRVIALNAPSLRPESGIDAWTEYAQRRVDVIDLEERRFRSLRFEEVVAESPELPTRLFATRRGTRWVLGFDELLWGTPLVEQAREMLATLRDAYRTHVDVEFTGNFLAEGELRLNLVQCRPLQVRVGGSVAAPPVDLAGDAVLLASRGPIVGQGRLVPLDRVLYVDPDAYARLGTQDRHEVARVIGRATRLVPRPVERLADPHEDEVRGVAAGGHAGPEGRARHRRDDALNVLLVGPGRWGTTTPSLGVPVSFAEIQRVRVICEVMKLGDVIPDVSLGSHFFNDLVEEDMLYVALFPGYPGHALAEERLRAAVNRLPELLPDDARIAAVVRIVDFPLEGDRRHLWLHADAVRQEVRAYLR